VAKKSARVHPVTGNLSVPRIVIASGKLQADL
jgi:hypothetical protein